jgi:glycosyltransferase involved in cell wall biosynthesis
MNPKLSVLMPIYNGEKFLRATLDSLMHQSYRDFEIVAVNDGSTDNSRELVRSYEDARIRLIDNPRNLGQTTSLQVALDSARGEYVARQDQDDVSMPDRFAKQVAFLDQHSEAGALGTSYCVIDETGKALPGTAVFYPPETRAEMAWKLLWTDRLVDSSVMFRRSLAVNLGGYNRSYRYAQDYDLWVRMSFAAGIARLPDVLLQLRIHSSNASSRFAKAQDQEVCAILRESLTRFVPVLSLAEAACIWRVDTLNRPESRADVLFTANIIESVFKVFQSGVNRSDLPSIKKAFAEKLIKLAIKNRGLLGWRIMLVLLRAWAGYPVLPFQPSIVAGWWQQRMQARRFRQIVSAQWTE